ncbi:MAG: HEAT repeat domain-containing protein [Nitrospirota bacterium]
MNPIKEETKDHSADDQEKNVSIKMAADVLQSLSKAIKALKLYPDNSPVKQKFISDLTGKFTKFLEEYGDLALTVKQFDLLYQGEVVYTQTVKEESIAFRFFGDGIREVVFSEKLDEQEILNFIDVIQGGKGRDVEDDDIVTMMWEKDFKNIRYVVIEDGGGGESEGEREKQQPETTGSAAFRSGEPLKNAHKAETGQNQAQAQAETQAETILKSTGVESEIEQIYGKPFDEIFTLTTEEIEKVKQEMDREAKGDLVLELLDILFLILEIEESADSYSEMMTYIVKAVQTMIVSGDYKNAIAVLTRIKDISNAEAAIGVTDALGDEEFLQQLTQSLNMNKTDNIDELFTILTMFNKKSIIPLTGMLASLDQMKSRRIVCDALAVLAKDNLDTLLKRLQDDDWFMVRNIVYVLGRIGDTKVTNHLKRIKDHREPRVRKEIIHTLSEIKSDEAKNILVSYLNDSDNTVRVSALKRLVSMEHRNAVPNILNIISSETFETKENYEKRELFEALAVLGYKEQLPYLKELLMKKSRLFGRAKVDELRILSAYALRKMNIPEAMDILREGAASSDKAVKKICEDALKDAGKANI